MSEQAPASPDSELWAEIEQAFMGREFEMLSSEDDPLSPFAIRNRRECHAQDPISGDQLFLSDITTLFEEGSEAKDMESRRRVLMVRTRTDRRMNVLYYPNSNTFSVIDGTLNFLPKSQEYLRDEFLAGLRAIVKYGS